MIKIRHFMLAILCMQACAPLLAAKAKNTKNVSSSVLYKVGRIVKILAGLGSLLIAQGSAKCGSSQLSQALGAQNLAQWRKMSQEQRNRINQEIMQDPTRVLTLKSTTMHFLSMLATGGLGLWCTIEGTCELIESFTSSDSDETDNVLENEDRD